MAPPYDRAEVASSGQTPWRAVSWGYLKHSAENKEGSPGGLTVPPLRLNTYLRVLKGPPLFSPLSTMLKEDITLFDVDTVAAVPLIYPV